MQLVLIKTDSPEWEYMWTWLENHPLNKGLEEPCIAMNNNEAWQYMGSFKQDTRVIHQFRHREHPVTNKQETISVNASDGFTSEQIHVEKRL